MELSGDIFRLFRNAQDISNYYNLIRLIQESNCSAFVGAGLSVHAGYPTSNDLINYLATEGNIAPTEFNSLADFPQKATRIKKLIEDKGQKFFEILYRRFDERHFPINRTVPLYEDIVRIPFKSIITTNYDSCIEEAAGLQNIKFQQTQIYPGVRPNNLEAKSLYYIHGKIIQNDLAGSSDTLVLTEESYSRAYGEASQLPVFLNGIFDSHNILFIGFGLEEPTLDRLLELSKRRRDSLLGFVSPPPNNQSYKIAILPIESKYANPDNQNPEVKGSYIESIAKRDQELLNKYSLLVIRYYANNIYSGIKEIITNILTTTKVSTTKVEYDLAKTGVPG